uniref:Riboflavin kinase n=1 Tax=Pyramimonas obovata TaxID=1411642 RepID=A0A7S0WRT1_9CHLO|mmetsp:Transcript_3685/g.7611  ORF Transcript_3685/g.7611 Transcript_3685/m.7611 type:complete len:107 (+) Transcript_3685:1-321(+)
MSLKKDWLAKFQCVITGDDVTNGKPDPEIFEKAARALGSEPGPHCIVFEDAPAGVIAGKAAGGMKCVGLRNHFTDDSKYLDAKVDVLLDSVTEFIPEKFGLPPYTD